ARPLFDGIQVEGVASDGRYLYAAEDRDLDGRILRYDPETGGLTVLREGLQRSEGVAACPDGNVFYTEKKRGHVMRLHEGAEDEVVLNGLNAPSFL
ncbi:YncE family protein, partial [Staphylococcus aureus]